jgi:hypothetical protein
MLAKDLKRAGIYISGLLTTLFEALSNLINQLVWRQISNPISILLAVDVATFIIHRIKCYSNNLQIKNNEDRINELGLSSPKIEILREENFKLKKENSKIVLFF